MKAVDKTRARLWAHRVYCVGLIVKGFDGIVETVAGFIFLLVSNAALYRFVFRLTAAEIAEDPDDWIANALRHGFDHLPAATKVFAGVYLLGHGVLKVLLVAALFRRRRWAYLTGLGVLILFIGYQTIRFFQTRSLGLLGLTAFDAVIAALVWREYRQAMRRETRGAKTDT